MKAPGDEQRARYLELSEQLMQHAQLARNHAMKPGNVWLAKAEISRISQLVSELEALLDEIKAKDEQGK